MKLCKPIVLFLILSVNLIECDVYYQQIHMSKFCKEEVRNYYLTSAEGKSVAIVKSYIEKDGCEVIANCSVVVIPPIGHALLVMPLKVNIAHDIGALHIVLDEHVLWDSLEKWNGSDHKLIKSAPTMKDGRAEVIFEMRRPASTWKHANFSVLFTSFVPLEGDSCPQPFYYDCGNGRCVRESLRCDNQNNCGNWMDEENCGISQAALITLIIMSSSCIIFFVAVLYLQNRQGLLRTILRQNPRIIIKSVD